MQLVVCLWSQQRNPTDFKTWAESWDKAGRCGGTCVGIKRSSGSVTRLVTALFFYQIFSDARLGKSVVL